MITRIRRGPDGRIYTKGEWDRIAHFDADNHPVYRHQLQAEAQARLQQPPARPVIEVKRYKSSKDFERDAQQRVAQGWTIQGQSQETGRTHRIRRATSGALIGGLFTMPFAGAVIGGLSGKRDEGPITVTWVRQTG